MAVHFFVNGDRRLATARYRGYLMSEYLNKLGVESIVHTPIYPSSFWSLSKKRLFLFKVNFLKLLAVRKGDVIYLVRTIYQWDFIFLVLFFRLFFKKIVILDFDDPKFITFPVRMNLLTRVSSGVVVGSHFLLDWAMKKNQKSFLVPTGIPFSIYQQAPLIDNKRGNFVIGWIGSGSAHVENFSDFLPVIEQLTISGRKFIFRLAGVSGDRQIINMLEKVQERGLKVEYVDGVDWSSPEKVASLIKTFDVGVMPLVNNTWNQGKCSFKAIEYMACGVVTVASAVGENNYVITDGVDGFLCRDKDEWVQRLSFVMDNYSGCRPLADEGQRTIEKKYSLESNSIKLANIIETLVLSSK